jgi:uncharacterized DUF497 family protein
MLRLTKFTWDPAKAAVNETKHGVAFEEALTVFGDPLARIHSDAAHSEREGREIIVGHSTKGQLLLVSFTERAGVTRLISARRATRHEREDYEEASRT